MPCGRFFSVPVKNLHGFFVNDIWVRVRKAMHKLTKMVE